MPPMKVTVVGAGNVGASVAQQLLAQQLGDVVMVDIAGDLAAGKALDLNQSAALLGYAHRVVGTADYAATAGSEVVIITSGSPRKPGMSRDDLLKINCAIVANVAEQAARFSPQAILIVVTNPLDAMTYAAFKATGFPPQRVLGMAGVLDSARFRYFLSEELKLPLTQIEALVLGGHGDEMVPCLPLARANGRPVSELLSPERLAALVARTRSGGAEIVQLLKTGSAYYAPAASAVRMARAVLNDEHALLPCAVWLTGQYGFDRLVLGVPVNLGRRGVEQVVEMELSEADRQGLALSAQSVRGLCQQVDAWFAQAAGGSEPEPFDPRR